MGYKLLSYLGSFENITYLFTSVKELKEWQICFPEKKSFNCRTQLKVQATEMG